MILGAIDLVRRTTHVLMTGSTDFPPREIHPPLLERIEHIGSFDQFAPEELREQFAAMRNDLLGIIEQIWAAVEEMFLSMFHEGGVRLPPTDQADMRWMALI